MGGFAMSMKKVSVVLAVGLLAANASATASGPTAAAILGHTCAGCHGTNGASVGPAPIIGGLPESYLASTMTAYKDGTRFATVMDRLARGYSAAEIQEMSKFLAAQPWVSGKRPVDATLAEKGKQIHNTNGCAGCHGPTGISPMPTTPRMAGQYADYLYFQMQDYKDAQKAVPAAGMVMRSMLSAVSDDDLKALAAFYASAQ
jgi:sulfide dehydrogenase cytochrome subunit